MIKELIDIKFGKLQPGNISAEETEEIMNFLRTSDPSFFSFPVHAVFPRSLLFHQKDMAFPYKVPKPDE